MLSNHLQSLVLLTVLPFFDLFSLAVGVIAQGFFDSGEPAIEAGNFPAISTEVSNCYVINTSFVMLGSVD